MIRALRVGNFKAFADTQELPIRPITLIFGPNSAGKSSIIHSLALAHNAAATGELDAHRTEIGGESIDLGGFRQYVHRRQANRRVEWAVDLTRGRMTGQLATLLAPVETVRVGLTIGAGFVDDEQPRLLGGFSRVIDSGKRVRVETCEVSGDGQIILSMSARRDGRLRLDRLDQDHPVLREVLRAIVLSSTTTSEVTGEDLTAVHEAVDAVVPELAARVDRFVPRLDMPVRGEEDVARTLLFPVSRGQRREDLANAVRFLLPYRVRDLLNDLATAVEQLLSRLRYLGPLRSYPPRHLAFSAHHDANWQAGGGQAWDVVRRDPDVRPAVNRWLMSPDHLQTPYELVVRDLVAVDQIEEPLVEGLEKMNEDGLGLEYEGEIESASAQAYPRIVDPEKEAQRLRERIQASNADRLDELILIDRRSNTPVSHRDVGIGVSQVLPVLVNAYSFRNQLVAIEQPEIHLHPALQAELADVFIASALGEQRNTFLIETHSEHLILRLLRRIRETSEGAIGEGGHGLVPTDVSVVFVRPAQGGSEIVPIGITADGEFDRPWPDGFFAERARELM